MRVFVFGTRGFPNIQGGVEKHCEQLYPTLAKNMDITVFRRKPYIASDTKYENIRFIDLPSTKIKGFEAIFHSLLCVFYTLVKRPDVVHIHNIGPALFSPLLWLGGIKIVVTYHSANYEHKKWGFFSRMLLKLSEKIAFSFAAKLIFVNKFQLQKSAAKVQAKSCYIPNGVQINPRSTKIDYITSLNLIPQKYILSVGRITPEKGFDYLIDAFLSLPDNEEVKLVIAGGVEHELSFFESLKANNRLSQRVVFAGYVAGEKLRQLYSHAKLYILSSYNEGFPLVLLEAMGYSLPILASDIEASHLVDLDPSAYFPVGSVEKLAEKLSEQLAKPCEAISYDLSQYNWDTIAQEVLHVYKDVCKLS